MVGGITMRDEDKCTVCGKPIYIWSEGLKQHAECINNNKEEKVETNPSVNQVIEQEKELRQEKELEPLEAEASALASDPNLWHVTKFNQIIELLKSIDNNIAFIRTDTKITTELQNARADREKEMQAQLGMINQGDIVKSVASMFNPFKKKETGNED